MDCINPKCLIKIPVIMSSCANRSSSGNVFIVSEKQIIITNMLKLLYKKLEYVLWIAIAIEMHLLKWRMNNIKNYLVTSSIHYGFNLKGGVLRCGKHPRPPLPLPPTLCGIFSSSATTSMFWCIPREHHLELLIHWCFAL